MNYEDLTELAMRVRTKYNQLSEKNGGVAWDSDKIMAGFVGDVGDLSKLVMAKNGYRWVAGVTDVDAALRHELADCLWSVLVLAKQFDIDLEAEFTSSMAELEARVDTELAHGRESVDDIYAASLKEDEQTTHPAQ